jgi:hypothetical protein
MQDRPTAVELLDAIADFLVLDVEPHVPDWLRFQLRVARNSLQMIGREFEQEYDYLAEEWVGLNALLGEQPRPAAPRELHRGVLARNEELAARIRAGEYDSAERRRALTAHLTASVRDKLRISNPRFLVDDEAAH